MLRSLSLAFSVTLLTFAGCVWAPDSVPLPGSPYPPSGDYIVRQRSFHDVSGAESVRVTIDPYYSYSYNDSVQFIIVNGDTAYRHVTRSFPIIHDSTVPFHLDGTVNIVSLVYPSIVITDTSYEQHVFADILSPAPSDTVRRNVPQQFVCNTPNNDYQTETFTATDSANTYITPFQLSGGRGTVSVSADQMMYLVGPFLSADLNIHSFSVSSSIEHHVYLDRIIQYPLR